MKTGLAEIRALERKIAKKYTQEWGANFRLKSGETGTCTYILTVTDEEVLGATLEGAVLDGDNDGFLTKAQYKELAQMVAEIDSTLRSPSSNKTGLSEQERIK